MNSDAGTAEPSAPPKLIRALWLIGVLLPIAALADVMMLGALGVSVLFAALSLLLVVTASLFWAGGMRGKLKRLLLGMAIALPLLTMWVALFAAGAGGI